MDEAINILVPFGYSDITEEDVRKGKRYILRREAAAVAASDAVLGILKDAAERIVLLCYKYNVDPKEFRISSRYNKELFEEIARILDDAEDEILDIVLDFSTRCTESKDRRASLLPWVLALGRGNKNLRQTLDTRLWNFSRDMEAAVVAMRMAGRKQSDAVERILSNLNSIYSMPEMRAAFAKSTSVKATFVRSKGIKYGNVGNSNSETVNIDRFTRMTVQLAWMRSQLMDFKESGADGYYQLRGSSYPCQMCDDETGFHEGIDGMMEDPYPHFHCQCYRIPAYREKR